MFDILTNAKNICSQHLFCLWRECSREDCTDFCTIRQCMVQKCVVPQRISAGLIDEKMKHADSGIYVSKGEVRKMYSNRANYMRTKDIRSERRIRRNRVRRQRELTKNFLILAMTLCLIISFSVALSGFRSNAQDDSVEASYKYYKSIVISGNDTLWSIAEEHMDKEHYDSINDYINEVRSMNSLAGDSIHYGTHLIIPYYDSAYIGS